MASEGLRTVSIGFKIDTTNQMARSSKISTDSKRSRKGSMIQDEIEEV